MATRSSSTRIPKKRHGVPAAQEPHSRLLEDDRFLQEVTSPAPERRHPEVPGWEWRSDAAPFGRGARASTRERGIARRTPRLLERFATLVRESGSGDGQTCRREYLVNRLNVLGISVDVLEPELFLSVPRRSEVRIQDADGESLIRRGRRRSRCRRTARRSSGEIVHVPSKYASGTGDVSSTCPTRRKAVAATRTPCAAGSCSPRGSRHRRPSRGSSGAERSRKSSSIRVSGSTRASAPRSGARRPASRSRASHACRWSVSTMRTENA